VPQADRPLNVGRQVDIGAAVTGLTGQGGQGGQGGGPRPGPGVARVAVAQREPDEDVLGVFTSITDPAAISLAGADQDAWITVAPDWVGLPPGASYRLYAVRASGARTLLATGPSARLQPDAILQAAGLSPSPSQSQTVTLSYQASTGQQPVTATIPLTFTPVSGAPYPLAPDVAPVSSGPDITVHYDLAGQTSLTAPELVVTAPGRMNPFENFYHPIYTQPLTAGSSGTVQIPVSKLQGGGIYGVGIQASPSDFFFSDFGYTRVTGAPSDVRPAAPLLSAPGVPAGHLATIPYGGKFTVSWSVASVPRATGALLEISAGGPTLDGSYATFNNPDGTIRDDDGQDSGSIYAVRLSGRSGNTTLTGLQAGLYPSMYHNIRVIPLLASGTAAGEGSDVSTITMNGVVPTDGGSVTEGYGINSTGTDGFLTGSPINSGGNPPASVETFSQATNAITGTVATSTSDSYTGAGFGGPMVFPDDTGLYADTTQGGAGTTTYDLLHPVASGTGAGQWTPPAGLATPQLMLGANDQQDANTAFLSFQDMSNPQVFSSNVAADTFGPVISLAPEVSGFTVPQETGIAQDGNTALVAAVDFANQNAGPTLYSVNLSTGAVSTIPGVGNSGTDGVALDQAKNVAVGPELFGIGLYNLANGTGTFLQPGGFDYQRAVADPGRGEFVTEEVAPPGADGAGTTLNNNPLSAELVLNDQGQIVQRIAHFNFEDIVTRIGGGSTQLNTSSGTGYAIGLDGLQIVPFRY
jgi:hypothetical protein